MFLNRRFLAPGTIDVWGFQATHSLAANKKPNYGILIISNSLLTSGGPVFASNHSKAVLLITSLGSNHETAKYIANERV